MKLILLILSLLLLNCSTVNLTQSGGYTFNGIDFREYTEKGFQFTPQEPEGEYKSMGIVEVDFFPEIRQINFETFSEAKENSGIWITEDKEYLVQKVIVGNSAKFYGIEIFNLNSLLDEIYGLASGWGANTVANLRFDKETVSTGITWTKVTVRGFAILKDS